MLCEPFAEARGHMHLTEEGIGLQSHRHWGLAAGEILLYLAGSGAQTVSAKGMQLAGAKLTSLITTMSPTL